MVAEPMLAGGQLVAGIQRLVETPIVVDDQAPDRLILRGRDASDAGLPEYGGAGTLALAGSGSSPDYQQPVPFKEGKSCKFVAAKYFQMGSSAFADVATEDVIPELIFRAVAGTKVLLSKKPAGSSLGYAALINASTQLEFNLVASGPISVSVVTVALTVGAWYHAIGFMRRAGFGQLYLWAAASGAAVDISSASGSLSNSNNFALGAHTDGSSLLDSDVAYASLIIKSGLLNTHLQPNVARERTALLTGHRFLRHASGLYIPEVL